MPRWLAATSRRFGLGERYGFRPLPCVGFCSSTTRRKVSAMTPRELGPNEKGPTTKRRSGLTKTVLASTPIVSQISMFGTVVENPAYRPVERYEVAEILPAIRHDARDTSIAAARRTAPRSSGNRTLVYEAVRDSADGLTDMQISDVTGLDPSTERPRRVELVRLGLIESAGITRRSPLGSMATVWRATASGGL
jgi:hypothetical protein